MSTDEYVPEEDDVRMAYLEAHVDMADPITRHQRAQAEREAEDAWTAFLARVRRDAARSALDGLAAEALRTASNEDVQRDDTWADDARLVARSATEYRDTHYPEETP